MDELSPRYNPKEVEEKWYRFWEERGTFAPVHKKKPYTIVIPPPNVTGILHMGHGLNNTVQDVLIRWRRMQGFATLWVPGTDHAGIATQNVVEKALRKEGKTRYDLGREAFIQRVWQWREEYGSTIIKQLKKLGCSCDWSRTRFTMDEGLSDAVLEVFIRLYKKGLIYRSNYIINWCPRCNTALSDEEVEHRELEGNLYYIKYPVKGYEEQGDEFLTIATTRPETMLADVAIGINPEDKRYKRLVGKTAILPLVGRELVIIPDDIIDPHFGTGALKVTPAHDPVDFEIGLRHHLTPINVFEPNATINENAPERFRGLDRFDCRKKIIEELKENDFLLKTESHLHAVGHCYRCHTPVEPRISLQWFVKMGPLARPAIKYVTRKKIVFIPERWTKVYLEWMGNIKDWCISRQIWWGHRIPVYYCKDCEASGRKDAFIVSKTPVTQCPSCRGTNIEQDPDVLDTWFSSWLWPFSTLGWPKKTKDLASFYPTSTLVTAQEIIFFWVARMIMSGLEFMGSIPFANVYIHGTVRDDTGKKMSKSLGNIIDPLDIIEEFGADALRFSLIFITAKGQDVFLSKEKFHVGRNFANKIWNATRFILLNLDKEKAVPDIGRLQKIQFSSADRWILSRLNQTIKTTTTALEEFRFNDAANNIYEFFWHQFCDWYLEISKRDIKENSVTQAVLLEVLTKSLQLLHPFMPFITEEIWQILASFSAQSASKDASIMLSPWPAVKKEYINLDAENAMRYLTDIIIVVRNIRAEMNVAPDVKPDCMLVTHNKKCTELIRRHINLIASLGNLHTIEVAESGGKPPMSATGIVGTTEIFLKLQGIIDIEAEKMRLLKKIQKKEKDLAGMLNRLEDAEFSKKAPHHIIEKSIAYRDALAEELNKLRIHIQNLEQL
ncbi:MAG: valine--tRNA ligase [Candidatus Omnitrophica bacterium]|nr:valine--tRNA ligase [Candidatus Omnitrophota bacterium]